MNNLSMIGTATYVKISVFLACLLASAASYAETAFDRIGKNTVGNDFNRLKSGGGNENLTTDIEDGAERVVQVITAGALAIGFALFVLGIVKFYSAQKNQQPLGTPVTAIVVGLFLMIAGVAGFSGASQLKTWLF